MRISWSAIYWRQWFIQNEIVFPENLFYEDQVMIIVLMLGKKMYMMPQCFYHYYKNTDSTMGGNQRPMDRIKVQMELYPRLNGSEFEGFKDIWEYNFYENVFFKSIYNNPGVVVYMELLARLKAELLMGEPQEKRDIMKKLHIVCEEYETESFAHKGQIQTFLEKADSFLNGGKDSYQRLALWVDNIIVAITQA